MQRVRDRHIYTCKSACQRASSLFIADRSRLKRLWQYSIVGKGNHSVNHIQKIKPMVERVCQEEGLSYKTEHNEGRIYVDLTGGQAQPPASYQQGPGQYSQQQYGQPHYQTAYPMGGSPSYGAWSQGGQQQPQQQYQQQHQQQQGGAQQMDYEQMGKKALPVVLRLLKSCCTVM